jgi:DNA polymerase-3 subunit chi
MSDVRFYHLTTTSLESALPRLLEKTLARGWRAVVCAGTDERVEALTAHLWTFETESFLPHGSPKDGYRARQPVWLDTSDANVNGAQVLFLTDGRSASDVDAYAVVAELFDGNDGEAVAAARQHWKAYRSAGHQPTYFKQDERGRWVKGA